MAKFGLIFFIFSYGSNLCLSHDGLPEVETPLGNVRGFWKTSLDGRRYAAFEGIPYAQPPVGDLRFEEPQPATPWIGTWEASNLYTCIQIGILGTETNGVEDCLYLNVYLPSELLNNKRNLDVVVSIHGGGFVVGSGHMLTNSDFFMDKDIILVTINYRLGLFGFLSTEDDVIPGNNGMKDQVMALKWIKENIASFGGNPNSITIIGLSAGGASVHLHYLSPLSKGLFTRGISQSGTALAPWVIKENPLEDARKLANLAGCPDRPSEQLKNCLKQRPAENLLTMLKHFFGHELLPLGPFSVVVEKTLVNPFLPNSPYLLLKDGKLFDAPWITSHTADDGLFPSSFYWDKLETIEEQWTDIAHHLLQFNHTLPEWRRDSAIKEISGYYLGTEESINWPNFKKFTQMFTDRYFGIPGEVAAIMQAKVTTSPVHYYFFNYKRGENKAVTFLTGGTELDGVSHGEDGTYLYGTMVKKPFSELDERLKDAFHDMLYEFASSGTATFHGINRWQPIRDQKLTYLNITGPEDINLQVVDSISSFGIWDKFGILVDGKVDIKDEL